MNDMQLIVLLRKYEKMLDDAIANLKDSLPDDFKKEGVTPIFKVTYIYYPILDELDNLSSHIEDDIAILSP